MVGSVIKDYLASRGITQTWLANQIGMRVNVLSDRLSGKSQLRADELYAIALALDVPIETFRPGKMEA